MGRPPPAAVASAKRPRPLPIKPVAPAKSRRPAPVRPPRPPSAEALPRAALNSIEETRRQLGGTSRSNVYKLIGARKIRSVKIGRRRFVVAASIDELIRRHAR